MDLPDIIKSIPYFDTGEFLVGLTVFYFVFKTFLDYYNEFPQKGLLGIALAIGFFVGVFLSTDGFFKWKKRYKKECEYEDKKREIDLEKQQRELEVANQPRIKGIDF